MSYGSVAMVSAVGFPPPAGMSVPPNEATGFTIEPLPVAGDVVSLST